jgi:hypothetical protein
MDDVIAIKVRRKDGSRYGLLAWGRIFGALEEEQLLEAVRRSSKSAADEVAMAEVCESLADVSTAKYFYEGLLFFAWRPIPFGPGYEAWRGEREREYLAGTGNVFLVGELE